MNGYYISATLFTISALCFWKAGGHERNEEKSEIQVQSMEMSYDIQNLEEINSRLTNELSIDDISFFSEVRKAYPNDAHKRLDLIIRRVNRRVKLTSDMDLDKNYVKGLEEIVYQAQSEMVEEENRGKEVL